MATKGKVILGNCFDFLILEIQGITLNWESSRLVKCSVILTLNPDFSIIFSRWI